MERKVFYDYIRQNPFNGRLGEGQVDGMEAIINEWQARQLLDTRWLAYMLATTYHETAHTMEPIREYGQGQGKRYGIADPETGLVYYGRGFVQLTWKENYLRFSELLGIDLLGSPDQAMSLPIATGVLFEGMIQGLFTKRALRHYFGAESDWYNARRIINGLDRAELIARYARAFWYALLMAEGKVEQAMQVPRVIQQQPEDEQNWLMVEIQELGRKFGTRDDNEND